MRLAQLSAVVERWSSIRPCTTARESLMSLARHSRLMVLFYRDQLSLTIECLSVQVSQMTLLARLSTDESD